ncbi:MAG: hypothetical protein J2P46_08050 [Zavarzinella sp.]|nr:hypothetical protein [Zavarzinella sp.]
MSRLLVVAAFGLVSLGAARGQCLPWYPAYPVRPVFVPTYPLTPAVWGAPAPKPLPPAPAPFVPKGAAVREDDQVPAPKPTDRPKNGTKAKEAGIKEEDTPRIPKLKLPLPGDSKEPDPSAGRPSPAEKREPPKTAPETKEPSGDHAKAVEQFLIPAGAGRGEPKAEVKVGFFNHSDREIVLDVNGEAVRLPTEQYVTLRLPRTFKWAEKGRKATEVTVPSDSDGIEIVFRK